MARVPASPDVQRFLRRPYHRVLPSGLWIPAGVKTNDSPEPARMAATYLCHSHVFDEEPTWEDAAQRLREYSLSTILGVIGGVSGALHPTTGSNSIEAQAELVRWLFEDHPNRVLVAADGLLGQVRGEGNDLPSPVAIFHDLQLVNAAKMALLEVPLDNETTAHSLEPLGEALLVVSDLIEPDETPGKTPGEIQDDEDRRAWTSFFLVNGRFHAFGNPMNELARSRELYLTDRPHLRENSDDSGAYMDLPGTAEDLMGMPLEELLARNTAVYSRWGKGIDKETGDVPGSIKVDSYFTEHLDFNEQAEEAFWDEMSASAERLREMFRDADCSDGDLQPYYVFPFERYPLVRHQGWAHCPSPLLLGRKIGAGLHYMFLNGLESEDERDQYLTYFGSVFEDYVAEILDGMAGDGAATFVPENTLERAAEGASVCDGVLCVGDTAVPIEAKSKRLTLDARTEGDWSEIKKFLDDAFYKAATQLDSTIDLIGEGHLSEEGLNPDRIRAYLPVVVTIEPAPMQPPLYNLIRSLYDEKNILKEPYTKPLQQLTIDDLEMLEAVSEGAGDARDLLRARVDAAHHQMPFKSWAWKHDQSLARVKNVRLAEVFEDMFQGAVDHLRSHGLGNGDAT